VEEPVHVRDHDAADDLYRKSCLRRRLHYAGAVLAVRGSITFGTIVAFMLYIRLFTQPLQNLSQAATSVQSMAAACERVFAFLDEDEMEDEQDKTERIARADGNVEFRQRPFRIHTGQDHHP
jgi:ATP-binding cassette subfamily B multidrug efflux pump